MLIRKAHCGYPLVRALANTLSSPTPRDALGIWKVAAVGLTPAKGQISILLVWPWLRRARPNRGRITLQGGAFLSFASDSLSPYASDNLHPIFRLCWVDCKWLYFQYVVSFVLQTIGFAVFYFQ